MTTTGRLEGRHCVVTGAAQGLGEAVARRYAAEGASVTMLDLDEVGLRRTHDSLTDDPGISGEVWSMACDVADRASVEDAVSGGRDRFGPVDVVASVAGIAYHVVPGVTAALAAAADTGTPVTLRKVSTGFVLATAHGAESEELKHWAALASTGLTLALYMGKSVAGPTAQRLIAEGANPEIPVGVVVRAGLKDRTLYRDIGLDWVE